VVAKRLLTSHFLSTCGYCKNYPRRLSTPKINGKPASVIRRRIGIVPVTRGVIGACRVSATVLKTIVKRFVAQIVVQRLMLPVGHGISMGASMVEFSVIRPMFQVIVVTGMVGPSDVPPAIVPTVVRPVKVVGVGWHGKGGDGGQRT